jgi:hypothetical protein
MNQESTTLIDVSDIVSRLREHETEVGEVGQDALTKFEQFALSSTFVVAVVGEFKRGKSTLLNGLLGQSLLPTDVTPTTATINIMRFSEEPLLRIHWSNGTVEDRTLSSEALWKFTAESGFDPDSLDYLEIGINSPLLKDGIVLVDTPGVNDLSQHRSDVAYRFLPRSDALIFVLSATNPVTASERDFLETSILSEGFDKIAFCANFADQLDEDNIESVSQVVQNRLGTFWPQVNPNVVFTAASEAADGEDGYERSGIAQVERFLSTLSSSTERNRTRSRRVASRAVTTANLLIGEFDRRINVSRQSIEALEQQLKHIEAALMSKSKSIQGLDEWIGDREAEILAMTRKSLRSFQDETQEALIESIESYTGTDFKLFVEKTIPNRLRQYCKIWIESHAAPLASLLTQIDRQVVISLSREFEQLVGGLRPEGDFQLSQVEDSLNLQADDVSKTSLRTGLIAGGAATLLMLMGAGMFVPVIGMAGLPFLSKAMTEQHLQQAKQKLRPKLTEALEEVLGGFSTRVLDTVSDNIHELRDTAVNRFDELLAELSGRVSEELARRRTSQTESKQVIAELEARKLKLQELINELRLMNTEAETHA